MARVTRGSARHRNATRARVLDARAAARDRLATLLAAVYASPRDLAARAVYADALQDAGDPRGEFITLQLASVRALGDTTARERLLMRRHRVAWLGPLADVVAESSTFRAGFLHAVELVGGNRPAMTAEVLDDPRWRTVESLDVYESGRAAHLAHELAELLARVPHLRELVVDGYHGVPRLVARTDAHALAHLAVGLPNVSGVLQLLRAKRFPKLETLRVWNEDPGPQMLVQLARTVPLTGFACYLDAAEPARSAIAIGKLARVVSRVTVTSAWGRAHVTRDGDALAITFVALARRALDDGSPLRATLAALGDVRVSAAADVVGPRDVVKRLVGYRRATKSRSGTKA